MSSLHPVQSRHEQTPRVPSGRLCRLPLAPFFSLKQAQEPQARASGMTKGMDSSQFTQRTPREPVFRGRFIVSWLTTPREGGTCTRMHTATHRQMCPSHEFYRTKTPLILRDPRLCASSCCASSLLPQPVIKTCHTYISAPFARERTGIAVHLRVSSTRSKPTARAVEVALARGHAL